MIQTEFKNNLPSTSKVWIYQANRILSETEVKIVNELIQQFLMHWQSHGKKLSASIELHHHLFVVATVDEAIESPSGCSIDSLTKFIKEIQQQINVDFFDRMVISYLQNNEIYLLKMIQFQEKLNNGELNENTMVFNNLVDSKEKLLNSWLVPVKNSWHKQLLKVSL